MSSQQDLTGSWKLMLIRQQNANNYLDSKHNYDILNKERELKLNTRNVINFVGKLLHYILISWSFLLLHTMMLEDNQAFLRSFRKSFNICKMSCTIASAKETIYHICQTNQNDSLHLDLVKNCFILLQNHWLDHSHKSV